MFKKFILPVIVIFVAGQIFEGLFHGVLLSGLYQQTLSMWRPKADMDKLMWIYHVIGLLISIGFVFIYYKWFTEKNLMKGLYFGLVYGLMQGLGMGYGMYPMLPMPYSLAISWFLGGVVEYVILGLILGLMVKD